MNTKKYFLYLCLALSSMTVKASDSLEVKIKLKSVSDVLTFNQSFVPNNSLEYSWTVLIDSDNNPSTGNTTAAYGGNTGFDVALSVTHFKIGSSTQTGSIVSNNTQKNTSILNGNLASVANEIRAFINYTDTSLVIRGSAANAELANVAAGNRYFVYTMYYSSTGIVTDVSAISTIPAIITDPLNDVTSSFIDIKEVSINLGSVGISESVANKSALNIFPNPSNGIFSVKSETKILRIEIVNTFGWKVYSTQINSEKADIDLSKQPKGIYFYQLTGDRQILKTGKIILE